MANGEDRGFTERQRERLFNQRKQAFAVKYQVNTGKVYRPNRSKYTVFRDNWLQEFAQIPREERTRKQWKRFEYYHRQIYGTNEEWGDYD